MKLKILAILVIVFLMLSFVVSAERQYDSGHANSPYNYGDVTGPGNHRKGTVYINASYNDNGYRAYRGGVRSYTYNNLTDSFSLSSVKYTSYPTGPSDTHTYSKSITVDTTLLDTGVYTVSFYFYFDWTLASGNYWPVSIDNLS